jgi:hypothetical protein
MRVALFLVEGMQLQIEFMVGVCCDAAVARAYDRSSKPSVLNLATAAQEFMMGGNMVQAESFL